MHLQIFGCMQVNVVIIGRHIGRHLAFFLFDRSGDDAFAFLDPENLNVESKIKSLSCTQAELLPFEENFIMAGVFQDVHRHSHGTFGDFCYVIL
jgi:hypothetical protein